MKYRVIWNDCEDNRPGQSFEVEAINPKDAYFLAEEHIKGLSPYLNEHFCGIDLESLVDESGKYHLPEIFLNE